MFLPDQLPDFSLDFSEIQELSKILKIAGQRRDDQGSGGEGLVLGQRQVPRAPAPGSWSSRPMALRQAQPIWVGPVGAAREA
jgi:hypothetical protein